MVEIERAQETSTSVETTTTLATETATATTTATYTEVAVVTSGDTSAAATGAEVSLAYLAEGGPGFSVGPAADMSRGRQGPADAAQAGTTTSLALTGLPVTSLLACGLIAIALGGLLLRLPVSRARYRRQH